MAADAFKARLAAQTDLIKKPDFDSKLKGISDRVTQNKIKYLLVGNELKKLQKFVAAYFRGKSHFWFVFKVPVFFEPFFFLCKSGFCSFFCHLTFLFPLLY